MKERVIFIDNLKAFAIICVILGHALQYLAGANPAGLVSFNLIYTFHMPLFMMMSGYFAVSSFELSIGEFLKKKSIQLLLPALTWSFCKIILSGGNICNNLIGSFWFLKSVFVCYFITYFALKIVKNKFIVYVSLFTISLFCNIDFSTYMLNYMLPSFVFGILLKENIGYILKYRILVIGVSLLIYLLLMPYWNFNEFHYTSIWQNGTFDLHYFLISFHRIILGLTGSLFLFAVFSYINKSYSIVLSIGASTLGLYAMNGIFSDIQRHVLHLSVENEFVCLGISLLFVLMQIPVFMYIIKVLKRYKILSMLFLGTKK